MIPHDKREDKRYWVNPNYRDILMNTLKNSRRVIRFYRVQYTRPIKRKW